MLELSLFIAAQWIAGRIFRHFGGPAILAEMITGIILGPEVLKLVPYAIPDPISGDPSILVLIGNMGVSLMIFESGMHLHFDKVKEVGKQALGIACVGTLAPIALGVGVGYALGFDMFPDALSIGVALAPTSVGISLNMLGSSKMLNTTPGQTIITAAFIDDIFSLVMLVILINVSKGDITAGAILIPLVASFAFVGFGVVLALKVMPKGVKRLIKAISKDDKASLQPRDEIHIGIMIIFVVFFGWIGALIGSHLLGTFVAGVAFAQVSRSGLVWTRQVKRIVSWMMRLFFSASIAFSIPVSVMFTVEAFWKGLVLAAVPCIGGKILSGMASGPTKWIVGWAMVARGEFAYLVAQTAKDAECKSCTSAIVNATAAGALLGDAAGGMDGRSLAGTEDVAEGARMMLSPKGYAALVWALLWSTILAPIFFKVVLSNFVKRKGEIARATDIGGDLEGQRNQRFVVRIVGLHHVGILHEVMDVLHACELDVLEAHAETDDHVDVDKFVVAPRQGGDLDDEKLHEIAARVKEAIDDEESQVVFEPIDTSQDLDSTGVLQIRMIGDHHPDILHEIFDLLAEEDLDVVRAVIDEHTAMDTHGDTTPKMTPAEKAAAKAESRGRSRTGSVGNFFKKTPAKDASAAGTANAKPPMKRRQSVSQALKETETIYARSREDPKTGKRPPVNSEKRIVLRKRIEELIHTHECHGEVMLRMVEEADAHEEAHPITAIAQDDEVIIITTHGKHHPDIIHEVLDEIAKLHLEVLHAEIVQPGKGEDKSLMYVRNNADEDMPETEAATERSRRHEIRKHLTSVFEKHKLDGHVSVRPLQGDRKKVIPAGKLEAELAKSDSKRYRASSDNLNHLRN